MVELYPHTLICIKPVGSTIVNGVPTSSDTATVVAKCRYRHNNGGKTIKTVDGQVVVYKGTCFTTNSESIATGDTISVVGQIDKATVLQVYVGQIRTRIILM